MIANTIFTLLSGARGTIVARALRFGGPRLTPKIHAPTDEPSAVATIAWVAIPRLVTAWRPILTTQCYKISCHSVFCHGSPQVTFTDSSGSSQKCELADLLLVVDEKNSSGTTLDRRAVLVQAKIFSTKGGITITPATKDQLELLETWPDFKFVPAGYAAASRDFSGTSCPGIVGDSGRYGGIDLPAKKKVGKWEQLVPSSTSMSRGSGTQLDEFLAGMVTGKTNHGREAVEGATDDWSKTIDELLKISAPQSVTLTATLGTSSHTRGVTAKMQRTALVFDDDEPPHDWLSTGPEGGISFVRLIVQSIAP
jgi:hypothetical protein